MQIEVMQTMLSTMTGIKDEGLLLAYLTMAGEAILNYRYQGRRPASAEVPEEYHTNQLEIAAYLLGKRGAEGETIHNENGVNRTYEAASVPKSMLRGIVPLAHALGG